MAAIQIPRRLDEPWAAEPANVPARRGARSTRPAASGSPRSRALPDRATRLRRRRLAALVAAVVLAAAAWAAVGLVSGLGAVGPTAEPRPVDVGPPLESGQEYVVQQGDTLWTIAQRIAPGADPRPIVDALREANGGPELQVGTRLTLDIE
ncbi:MAG TPA: LysM peptidoglycan-binding domain-containing protein [Acidimicrobiales bacterium]